MKHTRSRAGFTLLEVLVAVAILGLGLTVVLSAQTGVFWSYSRAAHLSQAPGLLRCKMSEVELELLKLGYPLLDERDEGPCCEGESDNYECSWTIEQVELPELPIDAMGADAGAGDEGSESGGMLDALGQVQSGEEALEGAGVSDLDGMMSGAGIGSMASMAMGLVYPALRPMLEASIRKVTVTVTWKEGARERELSAVQYLTSPQQGGFDPLAAEGLEEAMEGIMPEGAPSGMLGGPP